MNGRSLFLPLFFGACGGAVYWFNHSRNDAKLIFPLVAYVPGYETDYTGQGELTWQLFVSLAVLSAVVSLVRGLNRHPALPG